MTWCKHNLESPDSFTIIDCPHSNFIDAGNYCQEYNELKENLMNTYSNNPTNLSQVSPKLKKLRQMNRFHSQSELEKLYSKIYDFVTKGVLESLDQSKIKRIYVDILNKTCIRYTVHDSLIVGHYPNCLFIRNPRTKSTINYSVQKRQTTDTAWCLLKTQFQDMMSAHQEYFKNSKTYDFNNSITCDEYGYQNLDEDEYYKACSTPIIQD